MKHFIFLFTWLLSFTASASELHKVLELGEKLQLFTSELSALSQKEAFATPTMAGDYIVFDKFDAQVKRNATQREAMQSLQENYAEQLPDFQNGARENAASLMAQEFLNLIANLDISDHNLLVFALLEQYHAPNASLADRLKIDVLLSQIDKVVAPQIEAVQDRKDSANVPGEAILSGLTLYTAAKFTQFLCNKWNATRCVQFIDKPWTYWLKKHGGAVLDVNRTGNFPKVAGYLEYKKSTRTLFIEKIKSWRPKALSAQLVVTSILGGLAITGTDIALARYSEQKVPPKAMLRLTQVHRACDLAQMIAELSHSCGNQHASCDPQKSLQRMVELTTESSALLISHSDLANMDVARVKRESENLLAAIPDSHKKLFSRLLEAESKDVAPLCQRLALNPRTFNLLLERSKLIPAVAAAASAAAPAASSPSPTASAPATATSSGAAGSAQPAAPKASIIKAPPASPAAPAAPNPTRTSTEQE